MRNGTTPERLEAERKRREAFQMRMAGATYREIAAALGVSPAMAHRYVTTFLGRYPHEEVETFRRLELLRLDRATQVVMERVENGDLAAVDRLLRIIDLRMRILGGYQTQTVDLNQPIRLVWPEEVNT